jgi:hypothetical protein
MTFAYYYVNYTEKEFTELTLLDFLRRTMESIHLQFNWSTESEIQIETTDNLDFAESMRAKGFTLKPQNRLQQNAFGLPF